MKWTRNPYKLRFDDFWMAWAQCIYREEMRPKCWSTPTSYEYSSHSVYFGFTYHNSYWLLISITTQVRHHASCWDEKINQEAPEEVNSGRRGRWETAIKMLCWNGKSPRCLHMGIGGEGRGWFGWGRKICSHEKALETGVALRTQLRNLHHVHLGLYMTKAIVTGIKWTSLW